MGLFRRLGDIRNIIVEFRFEGYVVMSLKKLCVKLKLGSLFKLLVEGSYKTLHLANQKEQRKYLRVCAENLVYQVPREVLSD